MLTLHPRFDLSCTRTREVKISALVGSRHTYLAKVNLGYTVDVVLTVWHISYRQDVYANTAEGTTHRRQLLRL